MRRRHDAFSLMRRAESRLRAVQHGRRRIQYKAAAGAEGQPANARSGSGLNEAKKQLENARNLFR
jgi:hypothetical protein